MRLDQRNSNTQWQNSTNLEMNQLDEYDGHKNAWIAPDGYKKITVHLAYMIKPDGHHKGRLVADALHLTDVPVAANDPKDITKTLKDVHAFQIKGTGMITPHLGYDLFSEDEPTLCMAPCKYIEKKMIGMYGAPFGTKPKQIHLWPLERGDHSEMDTTELLDGNYMKTYQSLIRSIESFQLIIDGKQADDNPYFMIMIRL
jgi:hypothetical protein